MTDNSCKGEGDKLTMGFDVGVSVVSVEVGVVLGVVVWLECFVLNLGTNLLMKLFDRFGGCCNGVVR